MVQEETSWGVRYWDGEFPKAEARGEVTRFREMASRLLYSEIRRTFLEACAFLLVEPMETSNQFKLIDGFEVRLKDIIREHGLI